MQEGPAIFETETRSRRDAGATKPEAPELFGKRVAAQQISRVTQRASVGKQFANGRGQIAALRKDFILEFRLVGAKGIHRRNAPHGRIQFIK